MNSPNEKLELVGYDGRDIVSPGSFLRRLPDAIERHQRLRMDAFVLSADIMTLAYKSLVDVASSIGAEVEKLNSAKIASLLSSAWTIVDHLHNCRQLVLSFAATSFETHGAGPITQRFLDLAMVARNLRNKMDHLDQMIPNIVSAKGKRSSVYGSLSWIFVEAPPSDDKYVLLVAPGMLRGGESWPAVNPAGRWCLPGANHFQLNAYGLTLELGPPLINLASFAEKYATTGEAYCRKTISEKAAELSVPETELLKHSGGCYAFALKFDATTNVIATT